MRVLIADRFSETARADLAGGGFDIYYEPDASSDVLTGAIDRTKAEVLVVRSTRVTADMLEAGRLRLVIRAGAGFNTIDVGMAKSLDIYVSNCPGKNSNAVAEIAFGLMIALDRQIPANALDLQRHTVVRVDLPAARSVLSV